MTELSFGKHDLPTAALIGVLAGLAYLISYARHRQGSFTAIDACIVAAIMAIVTALAAPLVDSASENAKKTSLRQNLHTLRNQIERYKIEHRGQVPLLFKGGFPQLIGATNVEGIPGPPGKDFPFGPYLPEGVPLNPLTGRNTVCLAETLPLSATTVAGWIYDQATGRISADFGPDFNE